jgi:hypothetical protein
MNSLERLLIEAAPALRIRAPAAARKSALREIETIPFATSDEVGPTKAEAARGFRHLVRALAQFADGDAREQLAASLALAAKAIRLEPDRPARRNEPEKVAAVRRVPTGAERSQRTLYYLKD